MYEGKTKDLYLLEDGNIRLKFKDSVTGKDGKFDPGENTVGLEIDGMGHLNLQVTTMFFEALERRGIATHFINSNLEEGTMDVIKTTVFGKGVEVICRNKAVGSFYRRYGLYVEEGAPLDRYVEFTLKDDARQDPLVTLDGLKALDIMTEDEHTVLKKLSKEITQVVEEVLKTKNLELYDIKYEFGRTSEGRVILIDEVSSGNMRVYRGEEKLDPVELSKILLGLI